jgi:hypothetical protein
MSDKKNLPESRAYGETSDGGNVALRVRSDGSVFTTGGEFTPSQYDADLTMDGTAQNIVLADGVKEGAGRIRILNDSAFVSIVDVADNDTEVSASPAYITGYYVNAALSAHDCPIKDGGTSGTTVLTIPASAAVGTFIKFPSPIPFTTDITVDPDDAGTGSFILFVEQDIRVTFGTSSAVAEGKLNIVANAATTGFKIKAGQREIVGVPVLATDLATANASVTNTPDVNETQGI